MRELNSRALWATLGQVSVHTYHGGQLVLCEVMAISCMIQLALARSGQCVHTYRGGQ